eukprot:NODE_4477_length_1162_cov_36.773821_g3959_i0.p1 GENE.NODE_4477_length_1162_cov_36.773821_g3959_i0~~NODE_4477_length_1162_cov_36.773821_g3959_i0.p1  ORF type:complete len:345 (-),score=56.53 NODE_4477_length_1162_cov_36.773821_g3959_i0:128-1045(-)
MMNGDETNVDCGGSCDPCPLCMLKSLPSSNMSSSKFKAAQAAAAGVAEAEALAGGGKSTSSLLTKTNVKNAFELIQGLFGLASLISDSESDQLNRIEQLQYESFRLLQKITAQIDWQTTTIGLVQPVLRIQSHYQDLKRYTRYDTSLTEICKFYEDVMDVNNGVMVDLRQIHMIVMGRSPTSSQYLADLYFSMAEQTNCTVLIWNYYAYTQMQGYIVALSSAVARYGSKSYQTSNILDNMETKLAEQITTFRKYDYSIKMPRVDEIAYVPVICPQPEPPKKSNGLQNILSITLLLIVGIVQFAIL